jgi:ELWxxDGT repeat protein
MGGDVYFSADDGGSGRELCRTDGTPAGTRLVDDLFAGAGGSDPGWFTPLGDTLLCAADHPATAANCGDYGRPPPRTWTAIARPASPTW